MAISCDWTLKREPLEIRIKESELEFRSVSRVNRSSCQTGMGRELFGLFRSHIGDAESGATITTESEIPEPACDRVA